METHVAHMAHMRHDEGMSKENKTWTEYEADAHAATGQHTSENPFPGCAMCEGVARLGAILGAVFDL